jgi:hypothetical protein
MTGIQALERAAPSLPMKPGHVERREFEYSRHGVAATPNPGLVQTKVTLNWVDEAGSGW